MALAIDDSIILRNNLTADIFRTMTDFQSLLTTTKTIQHVGEFGSMFSCWRVWGFAFFVTNEELGNGDGVGI